MLILHQSPNKEHHKGLISTTRYVINLIALILHVVPYFLASSFMPAWIQALDEAALASSSFSVSLLFSNAVCGVGTLRPASKPGRSKSLYSHFSR